MKRASDRDMRFKSKCRNAVHVHYSAKTCMYVCMYTKNMLRYNRNLRLSFQSATGRGVARIACIVDPICTLDFLFTFAGHNMGTLGVSLSNFTHTSSSCLYLCVVLPTPYSVRFSLLCTGTGAELPTAVSLSLRAVVVVFLFPLFFASLLVPPLLFVLRFVVLSSIVLWVTLEEEVFFVL